MSLGRIVGIETEYGILAPTSPLNPMQLSALVVGAYRDSGVPWAPWDYAAEDPLHDARGFHLDRAAAHPSILTDRPPAISPTFASSAPRERRMAGTPGRQRPTAIVLGNGARLYVDHAYPEYSAPEVTSARDAAIWDAAGERIVLEAIRMLAATPDGPDIGLYKNNTDGKGASYGTHENYLVDRAVPFDSLVAFMTPFLVTRQVFTGSGRVGLGQHGTEPGFQLSQRADFIEAEVGLETTLHRPIVNTRDEPHADPHRWRRLHVIVGDATVMDIATYLRVGTTCLVLTALESGAWDQAFLDRVRLADPVAGFHQVSRDLSVSRPLALASGGVATALDIQRAYLALATAAAGSATSGMAPESRESAGDAAPATSAAGPPGASEAGAEAADLLARWASILDRLARDPLGTAGEVEWAAKYRLLAALADREPAGWASPRVAAAGLQWTDIRPERSLAARMAAAGAIQVLASEQDVAAAVTTPPRTTRAWARGQAVAKGTPEVWAANWDSVTLAAPAADDAPRLIDLADPWAHAAPPH
ncbi:MAG: proteasome accessory factor PafA2 [Bifidobacteriaceae bacterium]|nr:proteasome accessory factor PafA2 [Bifidobacteriaceae bacterium]